MCYHVISSDSQKWCSDLNSEPQTELVFVGLLGPHEIGSRIERKRKAIGTGQKCPRILRVVIQRDLVSYGNHCNNFGR